MAGGGGGFWTALVCVRANKHVKRYEEVFQTYEESNVIEDWFPNLA